LILISIEDNGDNRMSIGSGIAVAGVWLATAVMVYKDPNLGLVVGWFAVIATALVACAG
jgi:hypothetical protein